MNYTENTYFLDYNHPNIQNIIEEFRGLNTQDQIKGLYLKIRDNWRYNPYKIGLTKTHYISSNIATFKEAHCIDKAILLTSCLRGLNIPARLHFAKVGNHIAAEKLIERLGTNELAPHGLVDVYFKEKWTKCSPAFNKELCDLYNVEVLDYDGTEDMIMQEYNREEQKFMTYIEDYGSFDDVPLDFIKEVFKTSFPKFHDLYTGKNEIKL